MPSWAGMTLVVLLLAFGALFIAALGLVEVATRLGDRFIGDVGIAGGLLSEPVVDSAVVRFPDLSLGHPFALPATHGDDTRPRPGDDGQGSVGACHQRAARHLIFLRRVTVVRQP